MSTSAFEEMDAVWRAYIPEGCGPSRATVGVTFGGDVKVEMKVTAAVGALAPTFVYQQPGVTVNSGLEVHPEWYE